MNVVETNSVEYGMRSTQIQVERVNDAKATAARSISVADKPMGV